MNTQKTTPKVPHCKYKDHEGDPQKLPTAAKEA